jgi:hypothetical protein
MAFPEIYSDARCAYLASVSQRVALITLENPFGVDCHSPLKKSQRL